MKDNEKAKEVKKQSNQKQNTQKQSTQKQNSQKQNSQKSKTNTVKANNTNKTVVVSKETQNNDFYSQLVLNKNVILSFIGGSVLGVLILLLIGFRYQTKLSNGEFVVASIDGKKITSNELYNDLLDTTTGTYNLINMVDDAIFSDMFTKEEIKGFEETAQAQVDYYKNQFGEQFESYINYYFGMTNEEDLKAAIYTNVVRSEVTSRYAKEIVTDKEVEEYYNDSYKGDIDVSHILIKFEDTTDMSEEEIAAMKLDTLAIAQSIIVKLNDGGDFAELAKEYSDDSSASNGGELGRFNPDEVSYVQEFVDASYALDEGTYSSTPVETEFGYHIIKVNKKYEKDSLEDATDVIKTKLAKNNMDTIEHIDVIAMEELRKKYNFTINDAVVEKNYKAYLVQLKTAEEEQQ